MKKLLGGILVSVGVLIMTGSGLCSLAVIGGALGSGNIGSALSMIWVPAIVGGVPALVGFGLLKFGRRLVREADDAVED